ncbi:MAG: selenocysteine-specific translation elongation factor [candidate division NC10 bacterium RBG_16_65_8]|nr:MAG: selenocysteine-specific translation elongation factor [candidate division NC10 bacterium RBG_16_65_8]
MRHLVIGTAGHIDHGKTTLVKALTGTDTDRLKEEKERGISIELGFAFLRLPDGTQAGIVDVPGHERFVKTMVAGVGGIDLVVLVIAADEGVMPQTREHLHICELLQVKRGLVALTKADLVEAEWLAMVQADVAEFLKGTFLEGCPIVPCSGTTGQGLPDLLAAMQAQAADAEPRRTQGIVRLPVDRVFSIKGFGTVVTGTLWSGRLSVGDEVTILPKDLRSRVRRLQVHGETVEQAEAGQRTAVNVPELEVAEIERGDALCLPGTLRPSQSFEATLSLLADAPRPLGNRVRVRFHLGTSEVLARVVVLEGDELRPGARSYVHFRLETPSAALPGDRYVIRSYSPAVTIGGGSILDPNPPKARRTRARLIEHLRVLEQGRPTERVERHLLASGFAPMTIEMLRARCDLDQAAVSDTLRELVESGRAVQVGSKDGAGTLHADRVDALQTDVLGRLADFHAKEPLKDGLAKEELRSKLPDQLPPGTFVWMLGRLAAAGKIAVERDKVRLAGYRPTLSAAEEDLKAKIEVAFRGGGFQPPAPDAVLAGLKVDRKLAQAVFRRLVDDGILVRVGEDVFLHRDSHQAVRDRVLAHFEKQSSINVGTMKELFGVSRKYAIPYLEYLDTIRITRRQGDERVPYK